MEKPIRVRMAIENIAWNIRLIVLIQWRWQDFGSGEHMATKRISRAPQRDRGGGAPPMVMKFKIFKRFKVSENESIFQKYQHFSCQKNPFFSKKNFKILNIFCKHFWIFRKIIVKFQFINFYGVTLRSNRNLKFKK